MTGLLDERQEDFERRPFTGRRPERDRPAGILGDAVHDRQAEPGPLLGSFRREKWLEDVRLLVEIDSAARVADADARVAAGQRAGITNDVARTELDGVNPYCEHPAVLPRIPRVHQ